MKIPLCKVCLKTGTYCSRCTKVIENGEVSKLDINVLNILLRNGYIDKISDDVKYERSFNVKGKIYILLDGKIDDSQARKMRYIISRTLKQPVSIISGGGDPVKLIRELFKPIRVLTVSKIYLPNNLEALKIVISSDELKKRRKKIDTLVEMSKNLTGYYVYVTGI